MEEVLGNVVHFKKNGDPFEPYPLICGETTIGSDPDANIRLKRQDPNAEPIYCIINVDSKGKASLTNKSEKNPVKVNGVVVRREQILKNYDFFEVNEKKFQYTKCNQQPTQRKSYPKSVTKPANKRYTIFASSSTKKATPNRQLSFSSKKPPRVTPLKKRYSAIAASSKSCPKAVVRRSDLILSRTRKGNLSFESNSMESVDITPDVRNAIAVAKFDQAETRATPKARVTSTPAKKKRSLKSTPLSVKKHATPLSVNKLSTTKKHSTPKERSTPVNIKKLTPLLSLAKRSTPVSIKKRSPSLNVAKRSMRVSIKKRSPSLNVSKRATPLSIKRKTPTSTKKFSLHTNMRNLSQEASESEDDQETGESDTPERSTVKHTPKLIAGSSFTLLTNPSITSSGRIRKTPSKYINDSIYSYISDASIIKTPKELSKTFSKDNDLLSQNSTPEPGRSLRDSMTPASVSKKKNITLTPRFVESTPIVSSSRKRSSIPDESLGHLFYDDIDDTTTAKNNRSNNMSTGKRGSHRLNETVSVSVSPVSVSSSGKRSSILEESLGHSFDDDNDVNAVTPAKNNQSINVSTGKRSSHRLTGTVFESASPPSVSSSRKRSSILEESLGHLFNDDNDVDAGTPAKNNQSINMSTGKRSSHRLSETVFVSASPASVSSSKKRSSTLEESLGHSSADDDVDAVTLTKNNQSINVSTGKRSSHRINETESLSACLASLSKKESIALTPQFIKSTPTVLSPRTFSRILKESLGSSSDDDVDTVTPTKNINVSTGKRSLHRLNETRSVSASPANVSKRKSIALTPQFVKSTPIVSSSGKRSNIPDESLDNSFYDIDEMTPATNNKSSNMSTGRRNSHRLSKAESVSGSSAKNKNNAMTPQFVGSTPIVSSSRKRSNIISESSFHDDVDDTTPAKINQSSNVSTGKRSSYRMRKTESISALDLLDNTTTNYGQYDSDISTVTNNGSILSQDKTPRGRSKLLTTPSSSTNSLVVNLDSEIDVSITEASLDASNIVTPKDRKLPASSSKLLASARRSHKKKSSIFVPRNSASFTTPENNISVIELSDDDITPKSALKPRKSQNLLRLSIPAQNVTPDVTRNNDDDGFKTPLNTPAIFESLKNSAIRSRKRLTNSARKSVRLNLSSEIKSDDSPVIVAVDTEKESGDSYVEATRGVKRARISSGSTLISPKRAKVYHHKGGQPTVLFDATSSSEMSSIESSISESDLSSQDESRNSSQSSSRKPVQVSRNRLTLTQPKKQRSVSTRLSLQEMKSYAQKTINSLTDRAQYHANNSKVKEPKSINSSSVSSSIGSLPDSSEYSTFVHLDSSSESEKQELLECQTEFSSVSLNISGLEKLKTPTTEERAVRTRRPSYKSPKNPLNITGSEKSPANVKVTKKTPRPNRSPRNDLTNIYGVKKLMKTPSKQRSPVNDLSNVAGVKKLLRTPKTQKSPLNDLTEIKGVKKLMKTPKQQKSPLNDLTEVRGVKKLLKTPTVKKQKSPLNDLSDVRGVKKILRTPKIQKQPLNDLTDVKGVKQLMTTPREQKSPLNDLSDVRGVKKLLKTPKVQKSPLNDLSDVRGVKNLMNTPKVQKSPKNDLTNIKGVKKLLGTPKMLKSPRNDLTNIPNLRKLVATPKEQKEPYNDLSNVVGVKRLYLTEESIANRKSLDVSGVYTLFQATENQSDIENLDLFSSVAQKRPLRTYKQKSLSPKKSFVVKNESRKTLGDIPTNSPHVEKWVEEQTKFVAENITRSPKNHINQRVQNAQQSPKELQVIVEEMDMNSLPKTKTRGKRKQIEAVVDSPRRTTRRRKLPEAELVNDVVEEQNVEVKVPQKRGRGIRNKANIEEVPAQSETAEPDIVKKETATTKKRGRRIIKIDETTESSNDNAKENEITDDVEKKDTEKEKMLPKRTRSKKTEDKPVNPGNEKRRGRPKRQVESEENSTVETTNEEEIIKEVEAENILPKRRRQNKNEENVPEMPEVQKRRGRPKKEPLKSSAESLASDESEAPQIKQTRKTVKKVLEDDVGNVTNTDIAQMRRTRRNGQPKQIEIDELENKESLEKTKGNQNCDVDESEVNTKRTRRKAHIVLEKLDTVKKVLKDDVGNVTNTDIAQTRRTRRNGQPKQIEIDELENKENVEKTKGNQNSDVHESEVNTKRTRGKAHIVLEKLDVIVSSPRSTKGKSKYDGQEWETTPVKAKRQASVKTADNSDTQNTKKVKHVQFNIEDDGKEKENRRLRRNVDDTDSTKSLRKSSRRK